MMFNFGKHAAAAAADAKPERSRSLREFAGIGLKLELTGLIRKEGQDPKKLAKFGDYSTAGFEFTIKDVFRLSDSTDAQMKVGRDAIGQKAALVFNLKGNPERDTFFTANKFSLLTMLHCSHAAFTHKILTAKGEDEAREFKNPLFTGSYPTEDERNEALNALSAVMDKAFEGEEQMLTGSLVNCEMVRGNPKDDGGYFYNERFKPCFETIED